MNNDLPWFEVENSNINEQEYDLKNPFYENVKEFSEKGFTVLDLHSDNSVIDEALLKLDALIETKNYSKNPKYYHYNESPRIIEAWKKIKEISLLSNDKNVIEFLKLTYKRKPIPFSTINFFASTEQPLHSDYWHFGSTPERYLCGVWIAMEDIHQDAGPLQVVPNSFSLPITTQESLGLDIPKTTKEVKKNYSIYEEFVKRQLKEFNLSTVPILIKKGQCLIWSANLLHGAFKRVNKNLTRKSMVTHFHFENCKYYNPVFTDFKRKVYNERLLEIVE